MRSRLAIAVGFYLVFAAGTRAPARAQVPDEPPGVPGEAPATSDDELGEVPPPPEGEGAPTAAPGAELAPSTDAAWDLYHEAMLALASGRRDAARERLQRVLDDHPDHPATARARDALEALGRAAPEPLGPVPAPPEGGYGPPPGATPAWTRAADLQARVDARDRGRRARIMTRFTRGELFVHQSFLGLGLGLEACAMLDCEGPRGWTLLSLLGLGGGIAMSSVAIGRDVSDGTIVALNWGHYLGALSGGYVAGAVEPGGRGVGAALFLGQLGGLGLGALSAYLWEPTPGQVSLAGSGAMWGTVGALFVLTAAAGEDGLFLARDGWLTLLGGVGVGLVGGGLLGAATEPSRARALLVDVGAVLGMGAGFSAVVIARGDEWSRAGLFVSGLVGMLTGIGLSWFFTRHLDEDEDEDEDEPSGAPEVGVGVSPVTAGAVANVEVRLP